METFVVNETSEDVWFDNMMLMSMSSPIAQETHYDPWGLELTGIGFQYGGIKANKYLYNGKELNEDAGLQYYDYGARMYDPVIGRWGVIDPLSDMYQEYAPYNYVVNNPINNYDPDGRIVGTLIGGIIGAVGGATNAYIKGEDVFAGAVEGATAGIVAGAIVDITVATGGTGLVVIGAGIAGGALGAASGDVTGQVTENLRGGDNINAALSNVNFEKNRRKSFVWSTCRWYRWNSRGCFRKRITSCCKLNQNYSSNHVKKILQKLQKKLNSIRGRSKSS